LKTLLQIVSVPFLFILFTLCGPSSSQAASSPRWSVAIKGGLFAPSLSEWEQQYGDKTETIVGLSLGFKLTTRLEIGIEGAYFSDEGKALSTLGRPSGIPQEFELFPQQAYLLYQFAFLKDQALVPYLGGGYSRFTYRSQLDGGNTIKGAQEGYHYRAGLALLLDWINPSMAHDAEEWGLDNSYLFIEAQYAKIEDFGDAPIDLGGWSYWGGLSYEF